MPSPWDVRLICGPLDGGEATCVIPWYLSIRFGILLVDQGDGEDDVA